MKEVLNVFTVFVLLLIAVRLSFVAWKTRSILSFDNNLSRGCKKRYLLCLKNSINMLNIILLVFMACLIFTTSKFFLAVVLGMFATTISILFEQYLKTALRGKE
ncbi:MAG: hypothetical protein ACLT3H_00050 [Roseburia sp.]